MAQLRTRSIVTACLVAIVAIGCATGCAGKRPAKTSEQLLAERQRKDAQFAQEGQEIVQRSVQKMKAQYDRNRAAGTTQPVVMDLLIISGGGDWGAFGAGFLKGWGKVQGELARPKFLAVTGVSTGALIAPFAFIGDDPSIELVENLYRNPKKDWVKNRWPLYFLPSNISFAEIPGLERELRQRADRAMIRRIADESDSGRFLLVNTTDVDDGTMWVWDVGKECRRAVNDGNIDRVHRILLASAGIPAVFPHRVIDGSMYVDGGVTANILYGGRSREDQGFAATWKATYPDLPVPKIRYWVIFNNQLRPMPQVTEPAWPAVVTRSLEMGSRAATLTSMRHLFAMAEISRLKRGANIEVRVIAVPDDWVAPKPGVFIKETMNSLADLGEKMGADPSSWRTESP